MATSVRAGHVFRIVMLGVVVHILYLTAIFDVYFKSPLVQDLKPFSVANKAPAKRLVLFIADGLRADKFFETSKDFPKSRAPYLREIIEKKGSWGVSHSRVPTETRPGHVAVLAGFFEDVSAVTKGWQENAVDFDSTINRSKLSYFWGSCEVSAIFSRKTGHIINSCYNEDMIDFADDNGARLDNWVFEEVEKSLQVAKINLTLHAQLNSEKMVIFLHLLGIDVNGHGYRPNSQEYLNNIRSVDTGIKQMVDLFESFYKNDGKTAYLMTSDHGMSDWGSHGSGHPDETLTPIVAWGAGVQGPVKVKPRSEIEDKVSRNWQLDNLRRLDVDQIDIAALISTLIGIPFPVNSIGVLPVNYLAETDSFKAENLFRNARQILAQYKKKKSEVKDTAIIFRPFKLSGSDQEEYLRNISTLLREERHEEAMEASRRLIKLALDGLRYYHAHKTIYIAFCATLSLVGWIFIIFIDIFKSYTDLDIESRFSQSQPNARLRQKVLKCTFAAASLILVLCLYATSATLIEYFYCFMPLVVFYDLLRDYLAVRKIASVIRGLPVITVLSFVVTYTVLILLLVVSFTHHAILSLIQLGLAVFPTIAQRRLTLCSTAWLIVCSLLSIFPMLPNIGREEHYGFVAVAGLLAASTCLVYACLPANETKASAVMALLVGAVILCTFIRLHTAQCINAKIGLPLVNQIFSWILAPSLPFIALFTDRTSISRLVSIGTSFLAVYLLMSVSHEGIFVYVLCLTMIVWIKVEQELADRSESRPHYVIPGNREFVHLSTNHVRIAFTFLFFILLAFFGTGNIASLNSFDPAAVNCFITVYRPFFMASVLFLKILIPLVIVCCAFSSMRQSLGVHTRGMFYVVMVMTDIMSIVFFFLIKDEGSWQEIGISITHFVVMLAFIIFLVPIFEASCLLTGSVTLERTKQHAN